ncbi:hypothetical protein AAG565_10990 [Fontimonas sp. SYSU GA230001]|uniref:tetratricopeptide repeat protein n=1 Tax=Fontimonas sp. SYSU GA230001 TaxID=3142450 RepID=UPI0032B4FBB8
MQRFLPAGFWLLALAAFWLLYRPGLPGGFIFDDYPNLQRLATITTGRWQELLSYAVQGIAGPSGRPLSLLTFALQHDSWPADPGAFKRINLLIHAINASLLWWCFARLAQLMNLHQGRWIAPIAAALWLLWPIQVSSVLYVVQRMTLLAATCMFLGLALYVESRSVQPRAAGTTTNKAHALFLLALFVGIGLGMLCKENAIVFPLLVLAVEATLLSRVRRPPRLWLAGLWLPLAAFTIYLLVFLQPWQHYGNRAFDMTERVLTEGRVLWMYVQQIVLPSAGSLRFLYDNYPVSTGLFAPSTTALAWTAWLAVIIAAWQSRRRWPVAAFAVLFFLGSHVLESTIVPLELVFEHRNYLGSPAIALFLVAGLTGITQVRPSVRLALGALYFVMLAVVTFNITSLWGNPLLQKKVWYMQNPDSARVHTTFAAAVLVEGYPEESARLLDIAIERFPTNSALAIARAEIGCYVPELRPASLDQAIAAAAKGDGEILTAVQFLDRIVNAFSENHCSAYSAAEIVDLLRAAQDNPAFQPRLCDLVLLEGIVYSAIGETDRARERLQRALELDRRPRTLIQAASWELSNGNTIEARKHLDALHKLRESKPIQYFAVLDDVKLLELRYRALTSDSGSPE